MQINSTIQPVYRHLTLTSAACPGGARFPHQQVRTATKRLAYKVFIVALVSTVALLFLQQPAFAQKLAKPTGEILLTVSGNIKNDNHADGAVFDLDMLESIPPTSFETDTPWTEGVTKFTGVRFTHLLEAVGAGSSMVKFIAEDGYIYEMTQGFDEKYPIIIAYKRDDKYMSLRNLGPLWLMFPFDDHPELDTEQNRAASVWQLTQMDVK